MKAESIRKLIFAVAADLAENGRNVMVGPETERVCWDAIEIWKHALNNKMRAEKGGEMDVGIIVAAGWSDEYKRIMSSVMASFLRRHVLVPAFIIEKIADRFNTDGEIRSVISFLLENPQIDEVIIVARFWHTQRVEMLFRFYLKQLGFRNVKVRVHRASSSAQWFTRTWERMVSVPGEFIRVRRNWKNLHMPGLFAPAN